MALTQLKTGAIADDAVTTDKLANAINTERTANTAKDLTALSASNLTSGTVPDARFPATLPAASAANLTSVPAANITGTLPAISGANLTNLPASGKATNLIINGAMQVAQRGTTSSSSGYQTVDRFKHSGSGWDSAITQQQVDVSSGTTPYTEGFRKAFRLTNGGQSSGGQAGDQLSISYKIEDQDLATSGWNYLSATSYVTLSFWFKSSINQTFYVVLESKDGTSRQYSFSITPTGADTWTKVTKTIPGNSGLQFSNDEGEGIEIYFLLFYGTNQTTSNHTLNTWKTTNGGDQAPDMTATWFETDNALFDITGVLLEVGDTASDFPHKSFADDLFACQRYYDKSYNHGSAPGTAEMAGAVVHSLAVSGHNYAGFPIEFNRTMRTSPTMTLYSTNNGNTGKSSADSSDGSAQVAYTGQNRTFQFRGNDSSGTGKNVFLRVHYTADAEL